jgi:hypothetical protein
MAAKLSALLAGFFAGFLVPYLAFAALLATFQYRDTSGQVTMPGWFIPVPYLIFVAMPLLAGFVAARVAKVQPMLHGLFVGILGGLATSLVLGMNGLATIALTWVVCLTGGVVGGWLHAGEDASENAL